MGQTNDQHGRLYRNNHGFEDIFLKGDLWLLV